MMTGPFNVEDDLVKVNVQILSLSKNTNDPDSISPILKLFVCQQKGM